MHSHKRNDLLITRRRQLCHREKHGAQWLGYLLADLKEAGMIDKRIEVVE